MKRLLVIVFFLSFVKMPFAQAEIKQSSTRDVTKNGSYFDALVSLSSLNNQYEYGNDNRGSGEYETSLYGLGLRFGSQWYWGKNENRKMGLNVIWASSSYLRNDKGYSIQVLPLNLGFSTIWKLNETKAIEANINAGYAIRFEGFKGQGFSINPEVKIRMNRTLLAIGYQFIYTKHTNDVPLIYQNTSTHQLVVSVGLFQK